MGGLFPNAWTVAVREYRNRARSRVFLAVTIILAVIGLGLALLPVGIEALGFDQPATVSVVAASPEAEEGAGALVATLNGMEESGIEAELVESEADARSAVESGELDGLVTVDRGADEDLAFDLFTAEGPTSSLVFTVNTAASQVTVADRLSRAGVDPSQAEQIFAPTAFAVTPVDPGAIDPEENFGPRYLLGTALVVLMFMAIITYGQWVAASVAEEKASRVMELLITAATPRQLLLGKVLGAGGAGLTQYVVVVGTALLGLVIAGPLSELILGEERHVG